MTVDPAGHRTVLLVGADLCHEQTCATFLQAGVNVVGIVVCENRRFGLPFKYLIKSIQRRGFTTVAGQILGRLYYNFGNRAQDAALQETIYDRAAIRSAIAKYSGPWFRTRDFSASETLPWIESLRPEILAVHTSSWVGKKLRSLPGVQIVLGGHPGLTPHYRGSHSAFWAVYQGKPDDVGWSVFWLDGGVDTGDLISQGRTRIEPNDSYVTLGWKAMTQLAAEQARIIREYDAGKPIPRRPHAVIPENSEYPLPTLGDYREYRRRQNLVR